MKKVHIVILALVFSATAVSAQVCTPPKPVDHKTAIGSWQGNYTMNGEIKSLQIEFKEINDKLVSYIDMAGYGIKKTMFDTRMCGQQEFHMKKIDVGQFTLEFIGKTAGNKITGRLSIKKGDQNMGDEIFTVTKISGVLTSAN